MNEQRKSAEPCGGDGSNYFYFYAGGASYENNTYENIAKFAQEHIASCKDLPVSEIVDKHMYFGMEPYYNGDTFVLFDDIDKLPFLQQSHALRYCPYYGRQQTDALGNNRRLPDVPDAANACEGMSMEVD